MRDMCATWILRWEGISSRKLASQSWTSVSGGAITGTVLKSTFWGRGRRKKNAEVAEFAPKGRRGEAKAFGAERGESFAVGGRLCRSFDSGVENPTLALGMALRLVDERLGV
jgi:hypothetical protein